MSRQHGYSPLLIFLLDQHGGSLNRLFTGPWQITRQELLSVKGIGPETADSILLYAGQKPSFVIDAYTRRIFSRLGLVDERISYEGYGTTVWTASFRILPCLTNTTP